MSRRKIRSGWRGGLNLYGFVGGDPVNYSDPLGLFPCPELCASSTISITLPLAQLSAAAGVAVEAAAAGALGAIGAVMVRPAFPGSGKRDLGRGLGTFAAEATGTTGAPELPEGLTGENPRQGSGNRTNTDSKQDPRKVFDKLTGGQSRTDESGHEVGSNGVRLRPGTATKGPRIDIPSRPPRPHETIPFPPPNE